ncbi:hypothetical protein VP01_4268g1 [Puccinia sorghi]|uniref:Uncharacterized protein n=1 Tax=Puccinia sorghi TaxID=27349 RepID=A0A0L6USA6_9BASI|nr:hypothetical protein VP01_4268g1 [Puccinia sorghi]
MSSPASVLTATTSRSRSRSGPPPQSPPPRSPHTKTPSPARRRPLLHSPSSRSPLPQLNFGGTETPSPASRRPLLHSPSPHSPLPQLYFRGTETPSPTSPRGVTRRPLDATDSLTPGDLKDIKLDGNLLHRAIFLTPKPALTSRSLHQLPPMKRSNIDYHILPLPPIPLPLSSNRRINTKVILLLDDLLHQLVTILLGY